MTMRSIQFRLGAALLLLDAAGAAFDATALPAAGATRRSEILGIKLDGPIGLIGLELRYVGGASGTTGYPHVRAWVSSSDAAPADSTDASWRQIAVTDGAVTAATAYAGGGAMNGEVLVQPDLVRTPSVAAAGVMALAIPLRPPPFRWLYVEAAEKGDTAHPGTLTLGITWSS